MDYTKSLNKRPSIEGKPLDSGAIGAIARPLNVFERLWNMEWLRKVAILVFIVASWEIYARHVNNPLMFPTFIDTAKAWWSLMVGGTLLDKTGTSLKSLVGGYALGIAVALPLTILATLTRVGRDFLDVMTAAFYPLPAIALLPVALLWFGLGQASLLFVLANSVVWAIALSMHSGFKAVPTSLRMVGANYGLRGLRYAFLVLIPASMGVLINGLKTGWYFGWRTLIAAELYVGATSGTGGIGWQITESKNNLEIPEVFAGLITIMLIGLLVENLVFRPLEKCTIKKWGMSN